MLRCVPIADVEPPVPLSAVELAVVAGPEFVETDVVVVLVVDDVPVAGSAAVLEVDVDGVVDGAGVEACVVVADIYWTVSSK